MASRLQGTICAASSPTHAAEPDQVGAENERLDAVGAAAERAVDHDLGAAADRLDDLGQHFHRAEPVIELAAAVVRDIDPVDAVLDRSYGVLARGDALERQRNLEVLLDARNRAPVERRLELAAGNAAAARGD